MCGIAILLIIGCTHGAFGYFTEYSNTPYIVSLRSDEGHLCAGSIINERTILTAAHCSEYASPSHMQVLAGTKDKTAIEDGQLVNVEAIDKHESYVGEIPWCNDIALIRLAHPLRYTATVKPISLPESDDDVIPGSNGTLLCRQSFEENGNDLLQYANSFVVASKDCMLSSDSHITNDMFCTSQREDDINECKAYSGGPFVQEGKVIGVVSTAAIAAGDKMAVKYTRVSSYIKWIERSLKSQ